VARVKAGLLAIPNLEARQLLGLEGLARQGIEPAAARVAAAMQDLWAATSWVPSPSHRAAVRLGYIDGLSVNQAMDHWNQASALATLCDKPGTMRAWRLRGLARVTSWLKSHRTGRESLREG
jgi:hypothetical protein